MLNTNPTGRDLVMFGIVLPVVAVALGLLVAVRFDAPSAARIIWIAGAAVTLAYLAVPTWRRPIFLACEKCNAVQEVDSEGIFETIDRVSRATSFQPRVKFVEVSGLCRNCASKKD